VNLTTCIKGGSRENKTGYIITFDYDEDTIEFLKANIPHTHREWRPDKKEWWVSQDYESELEKLFRNFNALAHWQKTLF